MADVILHAVIRDCPLSFPFFYLESCSSVDSQKPSILFSKPFNVSVLSLLFPFQTMSLMDPIWGKAPERIPSPGIFLPRDDDLVELLRASDFDTKISVRDVLPFLSNRFFRR